VSNSKDIAKRVSLTFVVGAAMGIVIAVWIAPGFLEWWAKPAVPTVCSCVEQIEWALSRMRVSLGISAVVFAGLAVVVVEIYRRIRGHKRPEPASTGA
jgi:hypothetical protein